MAVKVAVAAAVAMMVTMVVAVVAMMAVVVAAVAVAAAAAAAMVATVAMVVTAATKAVVAATLLAITFTPLRATASNDMRTRHARRGKERNDERNVRFIICDRCVMFQIIWIKFSLRRHFHVIENRRMRQINRHIDSSFSSSCFI